MQETKQGEEVRDWAPNRHKIADLLAAVGAVAHLPETVNHRPG